MTIFATNLGGAWPHWPSFGYAFALALPRKFSAYATLCSSLDDEGRAASCEPFVLCQTFWTVKVALHKVPLQITLLAVTDLNPHMHFEKL